MRLSSYIKFNLNCSGPPLRRLLTVKVKSCANQTLHSTTNRAVRRQATPASDSVWRKNPIFAGMETVESTNMAAGLPTPVAALLAGYARETEHPRKTLLLRTGQRDDELMLVLEGSLRRYVVREERDVLLDFSFEGDIASPTLGIVPGGVASCCIETMEPTRLLRIPRERIDCLMAEHAVLADWGRRLCEERIRSYETYFADYAWMDKARQYERLLREHPQLLQRIALKDLASYLFLTPQSLSRIRSELR